MDSFEGWYREFHPSLVAALTVAAGDPQHAADAADEALTRAYERWSRVSSMASPEGWAYRVGMNVLRRRARRCALEVRLLRRVVPPAPIPADLRVEVWDLVRSLPPRQREALALRYLLDLAEEAVASEMGVAVGTASATLSAARARLAGLLQDAEVEVS